MFNVRRLSLLLLCADLFALQPPSIYHSRTKRELSERNGLPKRIDKMASSLNYADSSSHNGQNSKKANNTLSRKKLFAHLTRFKRSGDNSEGDLAKVRSVEGADCDKSTEYRLAFALAVVILLFIFFIIGLIYWYRRRIAPWKNEKEEWNQLLKDRLDDRCHKKMPAPLLPPRRYLYSQQESHNGGEPEYISLTDIRKYVDEKDSNDGKSPRKSTRNDNKRLKFARFADNNPNPNPNPQAEEKKQGEPQPDRDNTGNSADEVNLSGGYYNNSAHAELKIEPRDSESLNMDAYPENVATNSERIRHETAWQKSLKAFALNKKRWNEKAH